MKNIYEVHGDVSAIHLNYKGKTITTLISTEDLPKVSAISGRWYAMNVGGKRGKKIYAGTIIDGVTIYMHQIIKEIPPRMIVDHYNHCSLDNRRENLLIVTHAQNSQNRKGSQSNNRNSGYRNVYKNQSGNWFVRLVKDGRILHLGTYQCKEKANDVAVKARKLFFHNYDGSEVLANEV